MIDANEQFFTNVINMLVDGGKYTWIDEGHIFTSRDGKLECKQEAYNDVSLIVSKEFLEKNFKVKSETKSN